MTVESCFIGYSSEMAALAVRSNIDKAVRKGNAEDKKGLDKIVS